MPEGGLCSFECPIASASDATPDDDYVLAAAPFFEAHCIRCHDSARTVVQCTTPDSPTCRYGAPLGLNWNDAASIRAHLAEIREAVGVMPYLMPPDLGGDGGPVGPSCEARHRLVRFIDVGAPGLP